MENAPSAFLWNNQPLAALHQMAEMNSVNFMRSQQQTFLKPALAGRAHNVPSSASPPINSSSSMSATRHGINDILSRNVNQTNCSNVPGVHNQGLNPALFFNPQNMNMNMVMAASGGMNKNFQDFRALCPWMPGGLMPATLSKSALLQPGHDTSTGLHDEGRDRRGKKNTRPTFSGHQIFALEKTFEQTKYLAGPERAKLAFHLGMSESQVKVWFQNRRTKHRKKQSAENASFRGQKTGTAGENQDGCDSDSGSDGDV